MKQVSYRLAEALENICTRKSLENITVSQIAAEAGVTRQVFYHHFDDKFELASWIHYVHLYQSVKSALEEDSKQIWRLTTRNWMYRLLENKAFYMNAFQSVSQKEFQRIIRDYLFSCYKWKMKHRMKRDLNEEESFVLRAYIFGRMEMIYEWVGAGMSTPVERMVELLELAIPELIKKWILSGEDLDYQEALNEMKRYISKEGLLQVIS